MQALQIQDMSEVYPAFATRMKKVNRQRQKTEKQQVIINLWQQINIVWETLAH